MRKYHPLKRRHTTLVNLSAPPRIVIPSAAEGSLVHCRHRHTCALTQTTPWCFLFRLSLAHGLPVCKKDPSTSVGMTGGRRIASHSFSHRCIELCLFEAQSIVAGFTSSVSDLLPVIPYVRFTILQSSAPSGQSIPAFGRPLLQGGTRFKFVSILRGASMFLCAAPSPLNP